jgi:hypothetical protein
MADDQNVFRTVVSSTDLDSSPMEFVEDSDCDSLSVEDTVDSSPRLLFTVDDSSSSTTSFS